MTAQHVVGGIIQARARSRRLPEKILLKLPFGGTHGIVEQIVLRARHAPSLTKVVVASGRDAANDPLIEATRRVSAPLFRGSETDVLSRMIGAAEAYGLDVIVRLTGDNPCIDPVHIERAVQVHLDCRADYTKTTGLPLGMNVEVVSLDALKRIDATSDASDEDREHVTLFMHRHPGTFRVSQLDFSQEKYGDLRLTVDWPADYAFACFLYEQLYQTNPVFDLPSILRLLEKHPWATFINGSLKQAPMRTTIEAELREAIALLDLHGHTRAGEDLLATLKRRTEDRS